MVSVQTTAGNSSGMLWLGLHTGLLFSHHLASSKPSLFSLSCFVHLLILWVPNCCLNKLCLTVMEGELWLWSRLEGAVSKMRNRSIGWGGAGFSEMVQQQNLIALHVRNSVTWRTPDHHWVLLIKDSNLGAGIDIFLLILHSWFHLFAIWDITLLVRPPLIWRTLFLLG